VPTFALYNRAGPRGGKVPSREPKKPGRKRLARLRQEEERQRVKEELEQASGRYGVPPERLMQARLTFSRDGRRFGLSGIDLAVYVASRERISFCS
jgi:hypothetical protein